MADETRTAEVRLTANVDPYAASLKSAGTETGKLTGQIEKLTKTWEKFQKEAGKKLLLFSAGTGAATVGLVKMASDLEKRLGTLQSTAVVANRSMTGFNNTINTLGKTLPISNSAAAALVTQLDQLGVVGQRNLTNVADAMVRLSAATGTDLGAVTSGMVELSRTMGTLHAGDMNDYANSLLNVTKNAGTSADSVVQFANAIAPAARMAGMTQKEVMGVAGAFAKAGADGLTAANTFNKLTNDIARASATGSPMMATYANTIGVTREEFEKMSTLEAAVAVIDSISNAGERGIQVLDTLGIDGVRNITAIQRVAQGGGLQAALGTATGAPPGQLEAGSEAAMDGMAEATTKLGSSMERLGQIMGGPLLGPFTTFIELVNKVLQAIIPAAELFESVAARAGAVAAGLTGLLGLGMVTAKLRNITTMGAYVFQSSPVMGIRQGLAAGRAEAGGTPIDNQATRAAALRRQYEEERRAWIAGGRQGEEPARPRGMMRGWAAPGYQMSLAAGMAMGPQTANVGVMSRVASLPLNAATWFIRQNTDMIRNARLQGFERSAPFLDPLSRGARNFFELGRNPLSFMRGFGTSTENLGADLRTQAIARAAQQRTAAGREVPQAWSEHLSRAGMRAAQALESNATSAIRNTRTTDANARAQQGAAAAAGNMSRALLHMYAQSMVTTGATGMKLGLAGAGGLARGAMAAMGGPWGMAAMGTIVGGSYLMDRNRASNESTIDNAAGIDAYRAALGLATNNLDDFSSALKKAEASLPTPETVNDLRLVSQQVLEVARSPNRRLVNEDVANYRTPQQLAAWISSMGIRDPRELQLIQADIAQAHTPSMAQEATTEYFGGGGAQGIRRPEVLIEAATQRSTQSVLDWISLEMGSGGSQQSREMIGELFDDIANRRGVDAQRVSPQYAQQQLTNDLVQTLAATLTPESAAIGPGGARAREAQHVAIQAMEERWFGGQELGLPQNLGRTARRAGVDLTSAAERERYIEDLLAPHLREAGLITSVAEPGQMTRLSQTTESPATIAMRQSGAVGTTIASSDLVDLAVNSENVNAQYEATNEILRSAQGTVEGFGEGIGTADKKGRALAESFADIDAELQKAKAANADPNSRTWGLLASAQQMNQMNRALAESFMPRTDRLAGAAAQYQAVRRSDPNAPDYQQRMLAETQTMQGAVQGEAERLRGIIAAHRNFNRQVERSNEARQISLQQQEDAFQRQMLHSEEDYLRSRREQKDDFDRQMARQAVAAAAAIYNPTQRVFSQYTVDADTLLNNLRDQTGLIEQQQRQLQGLSDMGLSTEAIDVLGLADSSQAQNLNRLYENLQVDPDQIARLNDEVARRVSATTELTQNDLSSSYRHTVEDFERGAQRAETAYQNMVDRVNEAQEIGLAQAADAYERGLRQMREDLVYVHEEITGDYASLVSQATEAMGADFATLSGKSKELGDQVVANVHAAAEAIRSSGVLDTWVIDVTTTRAASRGSSAWKPQVSSVSSGKYVSTPAARQENVPWTTRVAQWASSPLDWFAEGGIATKATPGVVGEHGPEAIIPLGPRATTFMVDIIDAVSTELSRRTATDTAFNEIVRALRANSAATMPGGMGTSSTTTIDSSTTISGPITVQASDPAEMLRELRAKARVDRLTRPATTR